jgi:hypothetical protein
MTNTDSDYEWAFNRAIEYIKKDDVRAAGISFVSDAKKIGLIIPPFMSMIMMNPMAPKELIKLMSGFNSAPANIKAYYDNPELALDYANHE